MHGANFPRNIHERTPSPLVTPRKVPPTTGADQTTQKRIQNLEKTISHLQTENDDHLLTIDKLNGKIEDLDQLTDLKTSITGSLTKTVQRSTFHETKTNFQHSIGFSPIPSSKVSQNLDLTYDSNTNFDVSGFKHDLENLILLLKQTSLNIQDFTLGASPQDQDDPQNTERNPTSDLVDFD